MKRSILILALWLSLVAQAGAAACYADYKAKQDKPLRLHYGVAEISTCDKQAARKEIASRLAKQGWTLLNIVSIFDASGLAERKESAGRNFLRF